MLADHEETNGGSAAVTTTRTVTTVNVTHVSPGPVPRNNVTIIRNSSGSNSSINSISSSNSSSSSSSSSNVVVSPSPPSASRGNVTVIQTKGSPAANVNRLAHVATLRLDDNEDDIPDSPTVLHNNNNVVTINHTPQRRSPLPPPPPPAATTTNLIPQHTVTVITNDVLCNGVHPSNGEREEEERRRDEENEEEEEEGDDFLAPLPTQAMRMGRGPRGGHDQPPGQQQQQAPGGMGGMVMEGQGREGAADSPRSHAHPPPPPPPRPQLQPHHHLLLQQPPLPPPPSPVVPCSLPAEFREHFHVNLTLSNGGSGGVGGGEAGVQDSATFAGRRDVTDPRSLQEREIVSARGTVRGFKNRVRAGIATFIESPTSDKLRNYRLAEKGKIVIYTTSMTVVRDTYEKCKLVKKILQNHMVRYEDRDLYMSRETQRELRERLSNEQVKVPQIFADGIHLGGASQLETLNETGELRDLLKNFPRIQVRSMCQKCGGYRFVPCSVCHGSKKSVHRNHFTEEFCALRCMQCDENGLQRCDLCLDQQE